MRPSTSGRRSIDCTASICPVAPISSRTVSVRATTTSTGMPMGAPPPPPAGSGPPALPFLQAPAAIASAMSHTITCLDHVRSPLFLFGKEPPAEDILEPCQRQTGGVSRLDQDGVGVVQVGLRRQQIENCGRARAVTTLLDAEVLARHEQAFGRLLGGGARGDVAVVGGGHLALHRPVLVLADRPRRIAVRACPAQRNLALSVVPQREGDAERERRLLEKLWKK